MEMGRNKKSGGLFRAEAGKPAVLAHSNPAYIARFKMGDLIQPGWNLISVPTLAEQVTVAEFFSQCRTGVVWYWVPSSCSYAVADDLPVS